MTLLSLHFSESAVRPPGGRADEKLGNTMAFVL